MKKDKVEYQIIEKQAVKICRWELAEYDEDGEELELNKAIKEFSGYLRKEKYDQIYTLITEAMIRFPHSPIPHNLFGILLEKNKQHTLAMKHFRAAYALDPSYEPSRNNMELFGGIKF